jgi:hypothetical protein
LLFDGISIEKFLFYINQKMITICATGQMQNFGVLGKNLKGTDKICKNGRVSALPFSLLCLHLGAPRDCTRDEGGPLGIGLQEQVPNHLKLLW